MTTRDIVDQMAEILLAGSETTLGTISCLFLELACNLEVRAKTPCLPAAAILRRRHRLQQDGPQGTVVRVPEACIKESSACTLLRPTNGTLYWILEVNQLDGLCSPHTVVSASYRELHRNEEFWPQAQRFWPERWLPEEEGGDDAPAAE